VNALLGTVNALLAAVQARPPRAVVACFGAEQATYRVELFPEYHAHRDPMPAELQYQWALAPDLLASLGWTVCDAGELEADDAMGSFAAVEANAGGRALLFTGDRDLYQAVGGRTAVLELPRDGEPAEVGPEQVRERYGVAPGQVPDFIALRGDPSDGLPGAPGIGAKTAAELLGRHGSLEGALRAVGWSEQGLAPLGVTPERPRVAAALREHAQALLTFKRIATLAPIDVRRPADRSTDFAAGAARAQELGMNRLARRLETMQRAGPPEPARIPRITPS
jgi:5'-3' exonuclease